MKKVYYEKKGRRYVPVSEYDSNLMDSLPKGAHLIVSVPGGSSTIYNINPDYASLIAAGMVANDKIVAAIREASALRTPERATKPLTEKQVRAWNNLQKEMGVENYPLEWPSYQEAAAAGIKAMEEEAMKLHTNPAVQKAYEHFLMVCELTK